MKQLDRDERNEAQNVESASLYDRFAPSLFAYIYRQIASQQDAEDLLLDVFLAAQQHAALSTLDEERQLAWLRRVAHNKVIDRYRHSALLTMLPLDQALEREDESLSPQERVEQGERYERLYSAIEQLAPEQRLLVRLRYGDGLRLVEIAAMLDRPPGTVRKQLSRTLGQLRALYEPTEPTEPTEREHQP
ncbi:MAG TPA: sigma-70 family RNA polymerase sigma factor [Ktedonobacteraceae bacterium]|nr:sigma-70 family RNA polymerase sigma factor [Ktedonobacteraceae bacterium]